MAEGDTFTFRADHQLIVLKAVDETCGLLGRESVRLDVKDFDGEVISNYCAVLTRLGYIESTSLQEFSKEITYPICITPEGQKMLKEANKKFWQYAQAAALDATEKLTGIKLHSAVEFFKATYEKYQQEKGV